MSGAKVDVLAVIRNLAQIVYTQNGNKYPDITKLLSDADDTIASVAELIETCNSLLSYRVGEYPRLGYIRDNDVSRAQIDALATALSNIGPKS